MARCHYTRISREDMKAIREYIDRDNPVAARNVLAGIKAKCRLLAKNPFIGVKRADYNNLRMHRVGHYQIFYRPVRGGVQIVRILHGARDILSLFSSALH